MWSPVTALTEGLNNVYQSALTNDPAYLAEIHKKRASEEILRQARAAWFPQISGSVGRNQVYQNIIQSDNTVFASGKTNFPTTDFSVELRQSVINYANFVAVGQADATVKRFAAEFSAIEQDLMQRVAERYFSVLAANESIEYIQAEKQSVKRQFDLVQAKVDRGLANTVDYQDAQARLLQVNSREIELRNSLENSKADLKAVIGTLPETLLLLNDAIPLATPVPGDTREWINAAYDQNPSIIAKRFELEESKKEIEKQRGGYFPTVDLTASYNKNDTGGSLFGGGSEVDTKQFMLELYVPVFRGGLTTSRFREAVELHSKVMEELNAMMREVERNIVTAFNGVNNAIAKVEALAKLVEASESAIKLKRTAYDSGLASTLDVLDAERNLFFARSEYARARYEYVINTILLKRAAGLLEETDINEIDSKMLSPGNTLSLY
jgi:outer membrane protein